MTPLICVQCQTSVTVRTCKQLANNQYMCIRESRWTQPVCSRGRQSRARQAAGADGPGDPGDSGRCRGGVGAVVGEFGGVGAVVGEYGGGGAAVSEFGGGRAVVGEFGGEGAAVGEFGGGGAVIGEFGGGGAVVSSSPGGITVPWLSAQSKRRRRLWTAERQSGHALSRGAQVRQRQ